MLAAARMVATRASRSLHALLCPPSLLLYRAQRRITAQLGLAALRAIDTSNWTLAGGLGHWRQSLKAFAKFEFAPKVTCTQRGTRRAAAVHSEARNRSGAPCSSLHGRRTEGRLVSLVAVAALVCARKTAKSSASRMY